MKKWNRVHLERETMRNKSFIIDMTKDEMLRYFANKIVEDGIRDCTEFSNILSLTDYNTNNIKLENYKNEILQLLYRDERIADVTIDDKLNVDMVFYTDFCPFYYDDEESMTYSEITDNPRYQAIILAEFLDYMQKCIFEESYISIRTLINNFVEEKQGDSESKSNLSNFLKKSIIKTGFVDKYIDNISVYITPENNKEFEKGLLKIVNQLDQKAKKTMESEEELE